MLTMLKQEWKEFAHFCSRKVLKEVLQTNVAHSRFGNLNSDSAQPIWEPIAIAFKLQAISSKRSKAQIRTIGSSEDNFGTRNSQSIAKSRSELLPQSLTKRRGVSHVPNAIRLIVNAPSFFPDWIAAFP